MMSPLRLKEMKQSPPHGKQNTTDTNSPTYLIEGPCSTLAVTTQCSSATGILVKLVEATDMPLLSPPIYKVDIKASPRGWSFLELLLPSSWWPLKNTKYNEKAFSNVEI